LNVRDSIVIRFAIRRDSTRDSAFNIDIVRLMFVLLLLLWIENLNAGQHWISKQSRLFCVVWTQCRMQ